MRRTGQILNNFIIKFLLALMKQQNKMIWKTVFIVRFYFIKFLDVAKIK